MYPQTNGVLPINGANCWSVGKGFVAQDTNTFSNEAVQPVALKAMVDRLTSEMPADTTDYTERNVLDRSGFMQFMSTMFTKLTNLPRLMLMFVVWRL